MEMAQKRKQENCKIMAGKSCRKLFWAWGKREKLSILTEREKKSEGDKGVKDVTGWGPAGLQPASETNAIQRRRHQREGRGGGGDDDRNMAKGLAWVTRKVLEILQTGPLWCHKGRWQPLRTTPLSPLAPPPRDRLVLTAFQGSIRLVRRLQTRG